MISQTQTYHWNHEERLTQEEVEQGGSTSSHGASTDPLIKIKDNDKLDNDFVKLKLCRDMMSDKSDLFEFKMALFDNVNPEELFVRSQLQHGFCGIRNTGDSHGGAITLYPCLWRSVMSV